MPSREALTRGYKCSSRVFAGELVRARRANVGGLGTVTEQTAMGVEIRKPTLAPPRPETPKRRVSSTKNSQKTVVISFFFLC